MKQGFRISGTFELTSFDAYVNKLKTVENANLIDIWLLQDSTQATALDSVNVARNGSYVNNPVLQSELFADGANYEPRFKQASQQYVSLPAAAIDTAMSKTEGSLLAWLKLSALEAQNAFTGFVGLRIDGNNIIQLDRQFSGINAQFRWVWVGGAVQKINLLNFTQPATPPTDWTAMVITWSTVNNRLRAYFAGSAIGSELTPVPALVGSLATAVLASDIPVGGGYLEGALGPCALWTKELTAAEVLSISTVP